MHCNFIALNMHIGMCKQPILNVNIITTAQYIPYILYIHVLWMRYAFHSIVHMLVARTVQRHSSICEKT